MTAKDTIYANLRRFYVVVGVLFPPLWLLVNIHRYAINFPKWDDWAFIYGLLKFMPPGSWNWGYLFARHGVHLEAVSKVYYYGLGSLAHWNLIVGIYGEFFLGVLIFLGLTFLLRRSFRDQPHEWIFYPLASYCTFNLIQWPLYFSPWGICWLALSVILRMSMLWADIKVPLILKLAVLVLLAVTGSFCLGAGYVLWLAIPLYLLGRGDSWNESPTHLRIALAVWIGACLLTLVPFLKGYHQINHYDAVANFNAPPGNMQISPLGYCLSHPVPAVHFFLLLLGAPAGVGLDESSFVRLPFLSEAHRYLHMKIALLLGTLGLAAFTLNILYVFHQRHQAVTLKRFTPWICIGVFELVIAVLVMVGRIGGWGVDRAVDPHYSIIGMHFQLTIAVTAFLIWQHSRNSAPPSATFSANGLLANFFQRYGTAYGKWVFLGLGGLFLLFSSPAEWYCVSEIQDNYRLLLYQKETVFLSGLIPDNSVVAESKGPILAYLAQHGIVAIAPLSQVKNWIEKADLNPLAQPLKWTKGPLPFHLPYGGTFLDQNAGGLLHSQTLLIAYQDLSGAVFYDSANSGWLKPQPQGLPSGTHLYTFEVNWSQPISVRDPDGQRTTIKAIYVYHREDQSFVKIY